MSRIDIELEQNMRRKPSMKTELDSERFVREQGGTIEVLPSTPIKPYNPKRLTSDWFRTRYLEDSDE